MHGLFVYLSGRQSIKWRKKTYNLGYNKQVIDKICLNTNCLIGTVMNILHLPNFLFV